MCKPGVAALLLFSLRALATPSEWVPMRWPGPMPNRSIAGQVADQHPPSAAQLPLAPTVAARGLNAMLVVRSGADPMAAAEEVRKEKLAGLVLEGSFPPQVSAKLRDTLAGSHAIVVELTTRADHAARRQRSNRRNLSGCLAGNPGHRQWQSQGWSLGSAWIDTNSGFLRAARAFDHASVWLGNTPPTDQVVRAERYLQAIGDAEMVGARWIIALDDHFAADLHQHDAGAIKNWTRMLELLRYYESHPEWRALPPGGKLAVVQDAEHGSLLSGGIIDMIGVKHTPVRAIPPQKLSPDTLKAPPWR